MNTSEELLNDQDPDYVSATSSEHTQQKIYEENARNTTARKITAIVEKEFSREIDLKEKEVLQIQERLQKTLKIFHLLRCVIITSFYNRKQCQIPQAAETTKQVRIHPAIKSLLGKCPKSVQNVDPAVPSTSKDPQFVCNDESFASGSRITPADAAPETEKDAADRCDATLQYRKRALLDEESRPRKVPRYVPPKSTSPQKTCPSRGNSQKVRKRIIVGNISKWILPDWREDAASHKWTMYVRGDKDECADISGFVSKVRFFLHPSYRPNDIVEVTSYPFHLSRRGWGEFPLRVQLHFKNPRNKPMDIIHHLKLDRTYTGLQTLGSETVVDMWIHTVDSRNHERNSSDESVESSANGASVKMELSDSDESTFILNQLAKSAGLTASATERAIRVKEELTDPEVHEWSDKMLDLMLEKSGNVRVKVEPYDAIADTLSDKNGLLADLSKEALSYIKHDHNYSDKYHFNSHHCTDREGNVTIEHFSDNDCVPAIDSSAVRNNEETPDDAGTTMHRFNGDIKSSSGCQPPAVSNAVKDDSKDAVNTVFQANDRQKGLQKSVSTDANKSIQTKNSESSDTRISKNISAKDTTLINGFCKQSDTSLDRFNSLRKVTSTSNSVSSCLEPLQITIPPNVFSPSKSAKKHVLLLNNKKPIPVDVASILSSKSNENSRNGDTRDGNGAKLNVRISQGVSILKKPPNGKMNAQQKVAVGNNNNKKAAVLTLNSGNSILLNATENVPILKIADLREPQYNHDLGKPTRDPLSTSKREVSEDRAAVVQRPKITLGKDKYKIRSKRSLYEAVLQSIDAANIVDVGPLVRFAARRLPIVTADARDPEYRSLHPYACSSEREYFAHSIGKQRALEWCRARMIRRFLQKKQIPAERLWSVKEIVVWTRLHGYTLRRDAVGVPKAAMTMPSGTKQLPDAGAAPIAAVPSTCTEPIALQKWLQTCRQESSHQSTDSDVEEIDVLGVQEDSRGAAIGRRRNDDGADCSSGATLIPLELDKSLLPFHNFVCNTAREIGVKIRPEEIVPGVLYSATSRVITRVIECFVKDLVRSSLAKAWERNSGNGCPKVITLNDVRGALASREEFDIFTNEGLGSEQQLNSTELSNL